MYFYSILRGSIKLFDAQMLLQPFEEQFYSPSVFVKQGNLFRCNIKIIRVKYKCPITIIVIEYHSSKFFWILLLSLVSLETYNLVGHNSR